jgi:hypothetical protein
MNRIAYFNYIEEKLGTLAYRINLKGKLNILDLHVHSENFYFNLLNCVYGWDLKNLNAVKQNVEAIDLIDDTNKFILQVSATNTKQKVESTLKKELFKKYPDYTFKFVSISKEGNDLKSNIFENPHNVIFNPINDVIDNRSILDQILSLNVTDQKKIYNFIKEELGGEIDMVRLDSNLATIINLLSQEQLTPDNNLKLDAFEIERKINYNALITSKEIIQDYIVFNYQLSNSPYAANI